MPLWVLALLALAVAAPLAFGTVAASSHGVREGLRVAKGCVAVQLRYVAIAYAVTAIIGAAVRVFG